MKTEKQKKKEKKAAGVPWTIGTADRGVEVLTRAPQILVRGAVRRGLLATIAHFFTTGPGMLTLTALVAGASFFSLWDLNRQKEEALAKHRAEAFHQGSGGRSGPVQSNAAVGVDSMNYLVPANRGAANDGASPSAADAAASPPAPAADQKSTAGKDQAASDNATQVTAQSGFANRYGRLSTGLSGGNGLAGGAGLSGGVGRHFDKDTLAQLPAAMRHGSVSDGGAAATATGVKRVPLQGGGSGKGAMGQLRAASALSNGAKSAGTNEGKSYQAGQAFDSNPGIAGSGQQIDGAGDSVGGSGSPAAGVQPGSPTTQPSSTPNNNNQGPSAGNGTNVTPWDSMTILATILAGVAGILFLISNFLTGTIWGYPWKKVIAWAAAAIAAVVIGLGIMIMVQYGQMTQGAILTGVGALIATLAVLTATGVIGGPEQQIAGAAQPGAATSAAELAKAPMPPSTW